MPNHFSILVLVLLFVVDNIITWYVNRDTLSWANDPISAYLAGVKLAWVQVLGFAAMVTALTVMAIILPNLPVRVSLAVAAAALVGVVLTKYIPAGWHGLSQERLKWLHVRCAAVAFLGADLAILIQTHHAGGLVFALALAAPASALLFYLFAPTRTALSERTYTAFLLAAIAALVWPVAA